MNKGFSFFGALLAAVLGLVVADASAAGAAKVDSIALTGKIYDRLTTRHVIGTKVEVLRPDSSVISSVEGGHTYYDYNERANTLKKDSTSHYSINVPRVAGNYLIKVTKDGYEPHYLWYSLAFNKRDM